MIRQTVFITGASSGIGAATARYFAKNGWFVGLFDIDEPGLQQLSETIGSTHCCTLKMDVVSEEEVKRALEFFAEKTEGRMDVLVNNAAVLHMGLLEQVSLDKHRQTIDVNLWGVVNCTYQALPLLKQTSRSSIINVCSASSLYGLPNFSVYSATKHAMRGLTEAWSIEFDHLGIRVADVVPTFVNTPMLKKQAGQQDVIQRMGIDFEPDDIAKIIWQAAHSQKLHWILSFQMKALHCLAIFFPRLGRFVAKAKMMPDIR